MSAVGVEARQRRDAAVRQYKTLLSVRRRKVARDLYRSNILGVTKRSTDKAIHKISFYLLIA